MDIMNIVKLFGTDVWLISYISESKKPYKFCEVKNIEEEKKYPPPPPPLMTYLIINPNNYFEKATHRIIIMYGLVFWSSLAY